MSSTDSSDEEAVVLYYYLRRRFRRRYWVHPYLERNVNCRLFVAATELNQTDSMFISFYRMSKDSYMELLRLTAPAIRKQNTNMRECVGAEERILITLRYLATGASFVSIGTYFCRGETTVGKIIRETSEIIWNSLREEYMPVPDRNQWKAIAERFEFLWNIPNCVGAIDGKHVRIEKFPNSGSTNFNYKSYHSVVLLACCDADGSYTMIETGFAGRNSDGGIFAASAMKQWITQGALDIPPPSKLTYDEKNCSFPYYFVADEAFPLSKYLMRPYSKRILDNTKRIYNYRISRARKTIECTFGMTAEKWASFNGPIRCRDMEKINYIVKADCVLHNFVRKREGLEYIPRNMEDGETINNHLIQPQDLPVLNQNSSRHVVRNYLANYFLTPRASLPWQWKYCI